MINKMVTALILICISLSASAGNGGISLDSTRVVYDLKRKSYDVHVKNSDPSQVFLIQSWMESEQGGRSSDFIVTPPLYISNPASENLVKLNLINRLRGDREQLYWLNVKAVPSQSKNTVTENTLQIAVITKIKVFVRPGNLEIRNNDQLDNKITFGSDTAGYTVHNPTPYYLTFANVKLDGHDSDNFMVSPFSNEKLRVAEPLKHAKKISYQRINDFGGLDDVKIKMIAP